MTEQTLDPQKKSDEAQTPLMKQYEELKAAHQDEILMFRLGDFYEMFRDDARAAAPVLEVALTQRQGIPMCGIPYHAADRYISKLIKKGFKVAIAEQTEEPTAGKGIVRREVVRIISAGTVIESNLLKEKSNNFLAAVSFAPAEGQTPAAAGIAAVDISTGQFLLTEIDTGEDFCNLRDEMSRMSPSEILLDSDHKVRSHLSEWSVSVFTGRDRTAGEPPVILPPLRQQLETDHPSLWQASRTLLAYLQKMNPVFLQNLREPVFASRRDAMNLDKETIENLELLTNSYDGSEDKTLLQFLDRTITGMGARLIKRWIIGPLTNLGKIAERQYAVDYFLQESALRKKCREALKGCSDLERLCVRAGLGHAGPRDLMGLRNSLAHLGELKKLIASPHWDEMRTSSSELPQPIARLNAALDDCPVLVDLIGRSLADDPPISLENGGAVRPGYDAELDEKRKAASEGKTWLQDLEAREKETTGISNLKVGYTSVFGYYFEVTKAHLAKVPTAWHRKQTLVNNERYVNEELKNLEGKILGAEEQALRIERSIFREIVSETSKNSERIQKTAAAAAELDCLMALAETAEMKSLIRPDLAEAGELKIMEGWHPVVRDYLPAGAFVPNDSILDETNQRILILTGPNMAGKSTYLRQTALIVLMAQIGSFVPAKEARIPVTDRIFTRIGSGDRLAQGESTFMVEMRETARILKSSTEKSLVILDEVGRGTSTYDGISIAWAVIEHLAYSVRPKVLFATHYFELTHLAGEIQCVKNFNVAAKEWQDGVVFLHKILPGPADRSYGIHVAKLAGLPESVIRKSKNILLGLEREHHSLLKSKRGKIDDEPSLFNLTKEPS